MTYGGHVLDHGSSRSGRWLRGKRFRITLWIAAIEGLLYVVHVLHWWEAVVLAAIGVALLVVRRPEQPLRPRAAGELDLRRLAVARARASRSRSAIVTAFAIGVVAPARDRGAHLPLHRASVDPATAPILAGSGA